MFSFCLDCCSSLFVFFLFFSPPSFSSLSACSLSRVLSNDTACDYCIGGVSRRATYIAQQRARYPNTIVIDVGNLFYGTLFTRLSASPTAGRGTTIAQWVSLSGYDALGVGSNDFFAGPSLYGEYVRGLDPSIPIISSNLDVSGETLGPSPLIPPDRVQSWGIKIINGRKIGLVGCIDPRLSDISSPGPRIQVNSGGNFTCVALVTRALAQLKKIHGDVNIVIALVSTTLTDRDLAREVAVSVDGIDLVLSQFNPIDPTSHFNVVESVFGPRVGILSVPMIVQPVHIQGGAMSSVLMGFDPMGNWIEGTTNPTPIQMNNNFYQTNVTLMDCKVQHDSR